MKVQYLLCAFLCLLLLPVLLCACDDMPKNPYQLALEKVGIPDPYEVETEYLLKDLLPEGGNAHEWVKTDWPNDVYGGYAQAEFVRYVGPRKGTELFVDTWIDEYYTVGSIRLWNGETGYLYTPIFQTQFHERITTNPGIGSIASAKGLCAADFGSIVIGSTQWDVLQIDPCAYDDDGYLRTWHLVDEGVLLITYEATDKAYAGSVESFEEAEKVFKNRLVVSIKLITDYDLYGYYFSSYRIPATNIRIDPADRLPRVDPMPTGGVSPDMVCVSFEQQKE